MIVAVHLARADVRARALGAVGVSLLGIYVDFQDFTGTTPPEILLALLDGAATFLGWLPVAALSGDRLQQAQALEGLLIPANPALEWAVLLLGLPHRLARAPRFGLDSAGLAQALVGLSVYLCTVAIGLQNCEEVQLLLAHIGPPPYFLRCCAWNARR